MKAATLKALQGSIVKWEGIVAGAIGDNGANNCPLCKRFNYEDDTADCKTRDGEVCPVQLSSGRPKCAGTPYSDWMDAAIERDVKRGSYSDKATDDETVMCAVLELEFLRDLLPTETTK